MTIQRSAALLIGALSGACVLPPPTPPQPSALSSQALSLERVIEGGCLPYILGEKTEDQAMTSLHLTRRVPLHIPLDPPSPPYWTGVGAGLASVTVTSNNCAISMHGGPMADYRVSVNRALTRKLGPATLPDFSDVSEIPNRRVGCRGPLRYWYLEDESRSSFQFSLSRGPCFGARVSPAPPEASPQ
jgi:hypothetical protein